ncbi:cyclic GMP-AMP synthase-like receptor [Leguminivora glycinivorella]|uniref:cyclic GMP-AMP synthase-like receptor n=1 Tax=Leguminivora glycinivorella TaxID=1035111 RepID=UPI00200F8D5A|nr:cyclic GMP-AMP synthase-like receptor [Leguminivora glycinivorella]XP_047986181.1 cyclic GMP-AMP synthase-like receptor [Leguminivora glycinivorella]
MKIFYSNEIQELRATGTRVHTKKPVSSSKKPVKDLNSLLRDIYEVRDKPVRDQDFPKYFRVFQAVSLQLNELMKQADPYYERYSLVRFEGRKDRLRINKPDDLDMEIVIGLPVDTQAPAHNVIEDVAPGFVKLNIGDQLESLLDRGGNWRVIETAHRWLDKDNCLLRSLFMDWYKDVVEKALNLFDMVEDHLPFAMNVIMVEGQLYTLRLESPTYTLIVEDPHSGFRLDMDLIPALEFLDIDSTRMPSKRRKKGNFLVVPIPMGGPHEAAAWRRPLQLQEWDLLYMKQAIRLIKKLRDSQGLSKIESYHIKTIFYHASIEQEHDPEFWSRNLAELFKHFVKRLHQYLENKNIPYFWDTDYNLIGNIEESVLNGYAKKLKRFIKVLDDPSEYKMVAKYLMSESQFKEYKKKILKT